MRLPVWSAVAVFSASVPLLQEPLVLALQFVVEDDAPYPAAVLAQACLSAGVGAVDLRIVRELSGLPEAGVERLAGLPAALQAVGLQEGASRLCEHDGLPSAAIEGHGLDQAGLPQVLYV